MRPGKRFMAGPEGTTGKMSVDAVDLDIEYELVGEWKRANFMLRTFPAKVDQAVNRAMMNYSREYVRALKRNIDNQGASIGWQPITSTRYLDFKQKHATNDPNSLYRFFGTLYKSIRSYKQGRNWTVGIPKDIRNSQMDDLRGGNTLSVAEYAAVLEFGSVKRNIEARPLFYPSFLQLGGATGVSRRIKEEIRRQFPSVRLKF